MLMKRFLSLIAVLLLVVGSWSFAPVDRSMAADLSLFQLNSTPILAVRRNTTDDKLREIGVGKLDLNNSDVRDFRKLRGFYPNLASKIIKNAPYDSVEDVLDIPGLSETQKERLQANLDNFIVTETEASMNAGDDRYNPGVY
jgi:photosystem II PsbU protein